MKHRHESSALRVGAVWAMLREGARWDGSENGGKQGEEGRVEHAALLRSWAAMKGEEGDTGGTEGRARRFLSSLLRRPSLPSFFSSALLPLCPLPTPFFSNDGRVNIFKGKQRTVERRG